jgi:transposase-like protein
MTDKLGRRSGPQRKYTVDEKRSMVEETQVRGASVPEVAQRHRVNADRLSVWRRLFRRAISPVELLVHFRPLENPSCDGLMEVDW